MKKIIFFIPFLVILVTIYLYTNFYTSNSTDKFPERPLTVGQTDTNTAPSGKNVKEVVKKPVNPELANESDTSVPDEAQNHLQEEDGVTNEELTDYDSPNEDLANEQVLHRDLWKEIIDAEMEAIARGTWIGDPETMDPDELHSAIYNQLLEKFGDIPQVHTFMEYSRKTENNISMTLEERITGLEAMNHLFPSGSTRRTLVYYKWMQANGGYHDNPFVRGIISDADIKELQNSGITVETDKTDQEVRIRISTQ